MKELLTQLEKLKQKVSWPNEVRLLMIEKSEGYNNPTVYHYGYYDGYQKASQEFTDRINSLIEALSKEVNP